MQMVASNDLISGDVVFYGNMSQMMKVIHVEWFADHVEVFGYNPLQDRFLTIPSPFNFPIGVWNA